MDKITLPYAAGLFDGEGCIHINKWTSALKNGNQYSLLVQIKMCDGRLLHDFKRDFGGNLTSEKRSLVNPKHSDILVWRVGARQAAAFLKEILPYLRLKRKQALLAISFQEKMPITGRGRYPVTADEIHFRENAYKEMRDLKFSERLYRII